jgi:hypothetical protein
LDTAEFILGRAKKEYEEYYCLLDCDATNAFNGATSNLGYTASNNWMIVKHESERILQERVMEKLKKKIFRHLSAGD